MAKITSELFSLPKDELIEELCGKIKRDLNAELGDIRPELSGPVLSAIIKSMANTIAEMNEHYRTQGRRRR